MLQMLSPDDGKRCSLYYSCYSMFEIFHSKKMKKNTIFMQFPLLLGKIFPQKIVTKILCW